MSKGENGTSSLGRTSPSPSELLLLRAAVCDPDLASTAWRRWRASHDLDQLRPRERVILPSVAANLGANRLGDDAEHLGHIRRRTWAQNQAALLRAAEIVELLAPLERPPMLVKGAALCATVHEPGARRMGDIDIVVGPDQLDTAVELLVAAGWRTRPPPTMQPFDHAIALTDAADREVDLHRWLVRTRFSRASEDGLHRRSVSLDLATAPCSVPSTADSIVIAIVSGSTSGDFGSIRWPVDVRALLGHLRADQADDDVAWQLVTDAALDLRLGPIVARGLDWARQQLEFDIPSHAITRMRAGGLDHVARAEWWMRRHGVRSTSRIRRYVDSARALGATPSAQEYAAARWEAISQHGSIVAAARSRLSRTVTAARHYRGAR